LTTAAARPPVVLRPQLAAVSLTASALVALGVFLSAFVIDEPSPYDLFMAALIPLWSIFGLRISRRVALLLGLLVTFIIGGMISMLTMDELYDTPFYLAVSAFLCLTAVFFASIIEDDQRRLGLIFRAYVAGALITAMLGILGYFGAIPNGEIFTRYDRAMGAFQDPNVFGPFLVLPALYLMHGILTRPLSAAGFRLAGLMILSFGIFLSFSRAAWGLFAFSNLLMIFLLLLKERTGAFRLRILVLALVGILILIAALLIALQIPQVADLFTVRAKLEQSYDVARLGRFERHKIGFIMAMSHPLGIGALNFGRMFGEDTHNIWLKALMDYGWLGFVAYFTLVCCTLSFGFKLLLRDRPWQPFLLTAYITLFGHFLIGAVIDIDHWRHVYLLFGVVWGCVALEDRHRRRLRTASAPNGAQKAPRPPPSY
jgi:O-antigen ligase